MFKNGMRPIHPGEVLREDYLAPLDMSANALAKYFGGSPQFWLTLQSTYELRLVESTNPNLFDSIDPI